MNDPAANVGAIYSGYRIIADATNTVVKTWIPGPDNLNSVDFLRSTSFMTSIPLIRRSCFDDVGLFDEDLPGSQDQDMWIRLARRFVFQSIPDIVAKHHYPMFRLKGVSWQK